MLLITPLFLRTLLRLVLICPHRHKKPPSYLSFAQATQVYHRRGKGFLKEKQKGRGKIRACKKAGAGQVFFTGTKDPVVI